MDLDAGRDPLKKSLTQKLILMPLFLAKNSQDEMLQ